MTMSDEHGHNLSYLATEQTFQYVRDMHRKNLLVPLVGNFAGPTTIRSIARYLPCERLIERETQAHVL